MNTTAIPEWFANAISQSRTSHYLHYENLKVVHYVKYSPEKHSTNKPSIIWVHGGFAHAHWWDFFAPFFVENFNCFAIYSSFLFVYTIQFRGRQYSFFSDWNEGRYYNSR